MTTLVAAANMYGYRQDNGLMTNLNSISSSLSSIDTIGPRNSVKASVDNLIGTRSQSAASTNLLWQSGENQQKDSIDRYSTAASVRNNGAGSRYQGSEIYYSHYSKNRSVINYCPDAETAVNFLLVPLLLLTIARQTFDFLGQIWLQIIINFFTIIIIIVALFGVRQRRVSYLSLFSLWSLFNTAWNIIVICVHTKIRDVGIGEDALSFYTGSTSWWHTNGPGCLPYTIPSSLQPQIGILQPNIIAGCRIDYHIIESIQAILHASLSLIASLICCGLISNIRRDPNYKYKNGHFKALPMNEKPYRLNNLRNERSKITSDPYPNRIMAGSSLGASHTGSLRRSATKTSTRSSVHSVSSMRSARRRSARRSMEAMNSQDPPRGSTSSAQRSHKYGSLSSRRSSSRRDRRGGDINSLTYGTASGSNHQQRTRLSSLSSADYLPSYQPPHSSNANLLSSYGEISSIDSYNNAQVERHSGRQIRHHPSGRSNKNTSAQRGNANPTYVGSRSSICSRSTNNNANNYDDLSYIYGNGSNADNMYGQSINSNNASENTQLKQPIYQSQQQMKKHANGFNRPNDYGANHLMDRNQQSASSSIPKEIVAETHRISALESNDSANQQNNENMTRMKSAQPQLNGFQSFTANHNQTVRHQQSIPEEKQEINNNYIKSNYQNGDELKSQSSVFNNGIVDGHSIVDARSWNNVNPTAIIGNNGNENRMQSHMNPVSHIPGQQNGQTYSNNPMNHLPIYANNLINSVNSETPI